VNAVAIVASAQQPPAADFRRRVGLEYFNSLIEVFETMNDDDHGHLASPSQKIVVIQARTKTPDRIEISTFEVLRLRECGQKPILNSDLLCWAVL